MQIKLWLTNFGWYAYQGMVFTLEDAKTAARGLGFETTFIDQDGTVVAAYSPLNGFRNYCIGRCSNVTT